MPFRVKQCLALKSISWAKATKLAWKLGGKEGGGGAGFRLPPALAPAEPPCRILEHCDRVISSVEFGLTSPGASSWTMHAIAACQHTKAKAPRCRRFGFGAISMCVNMAGK